MSKFNRRSFLRTSATASALAINFVRSSVFGANERGCIGVAGIDARANALLSHPYRKPFVVPKKI